VGRGLSREVKTPGNGGLSTLERNARLAQGVL
jgi:hypothetical protein